MKFRNQILAAALCGAVSFGVMAESNYLHIETADGWKVLNVDNVDRLTFAGGNMTATDAANAVVLTVAQSDLKTLVVTQSAGVETPVADEVKATFVFNAATATATMLADGAFEVYNVAGALLVNIPGALKGQTVSLEGMEPGVVILKSGNYVLKTAIQ